MSTSTTLRSRPDLNQPFTIICDALHVDARSHKPISVTFGSVAYRSTVTDSHLLGQRSSHSSAFTIDSSADRSAPCRSSYGAVLASTSRICELPVRIIEREAARGVCCSQACARLRFSCVSCSARSTSVICWSITTRAQPNASRVRLTVLVATLI
ncbi:hypothetical protein IE81DRAFT_115010 [Ceraceosorus guamensis]|uniref:Uncharacterized protein n=1 Tax=Ceraceosorus guamensis TaxID=1522189 RepID=A0A316W2H4_9BASI|nr:hypothetical protein IE81DRAFT_115010 [Ceraceosorus guamensis]PWN42771.1 hypothetical protein IE81DRAFT_115010 [Ceraceosorus guamensis]